MKYIMPTVKAGANTIAIKAGTRFPPPEEDFFSTYWNRFQVIRQVERHTYQI